MSTTTPRPPGPPAHRRWQVARNARSIVALLSDPLSFVGSRFEQYGDLYYVREPAGTDLYVTRDLEVARDVLVNRATSFTKAGGVNDRLRPFLGNGLLLSDGELWRRQRRRLQPGFRRERVAGYGAAMVAHARTLRWEDGERLDMSAEMMQLTLRIACQTLFDHDATDDTDRVARTMEAVRRATSPTVLPAWIPGSSAARGRASLAGLHALIDELVARRRRDGLRDDLLSMLLRALDGSEDDDDQLIRDEMVTLFLAGHETTSHALSWTWMLLATHPEVEARMHAEVDRVLGGRDATADDLPSLPYTAAVARETLRLYPPAFALPRVAREEVQIGRYRVGVGSQVVVWIWHIHRDAAHFVDPESFVPERHLAPTYPKHAWMPFGAGPRMCIGSGFANLELVLVLATLATRYRFALRGAPPAVQPRITLGPRGGLKMTALRR